jgi:outer membrane receptor protein involved in Fe transport
MYRAVGVRRISPGGPILFAGNTVFSPAFFIFALTNLLTFLTLIRIMKFFTLTKSLLVVLLVGLSTWATAQSTSVSGKVVDENNDPVIGATIQLKGKEIGTQADEEGNFFFKVNQAPPFTVVVSSIGMMSKEFQITADGQVLDVQLVAEGFTFGDAVVVSASRVEEKILEAPVTIEKLDAIAIRQSATVDYYDELTKLKGVHTNQGSLSFTSINTRGFASIANTRFVQLMDGMDNAAPLLNFPTGNIVGISELDILNVELVPGAASALYGPNAFNGILLMQSKSPFDYQGLSAMVKLGFNHSNGADNPFFPSNRGYEYGMPYQRNFNPMAPNYTAAIRYARAFNDRFAFKFNFSYFSAQDWPANDYSTDRVTGLNDSAAISSPRFDGMNSYGDEVLIPVAGGITRTGWREEDLLQTRQASSLKGDVSLHYKLGDNAELIGSYRIGSGNSIYQGSERYQLNNFIQHFAKLELKGSNYFVRAYGSFTDDGDSYNLTALGSFASERIFPTAVYDPIFNRVPGGWATAYNFAYGDPANPANLANLLPALLAGTPTQGPGDHNFARTFADGGGFSQLSANQLTNLEGLLYGVLATSLAPLNPTPQQIQAATDHMIQYTTGGSRPMPGDSSFTSAINAVRNGLFQRGGAGFIDASRLYHIEGNYDFSEWTGKYVDILVGGNVRRYSLFTDGTVFNEGVLDTATGTVSNSRINIDEFGIYAQFSRRFFDDRLKLQGSLRYDKNQNFAGQFSPRLSVVFSAGAKRQHNFRASFQTGFRNPDTQAQFIYFPTSVVLLGGTPANAAQYNVYNTPVITETSLIRFNASDLDPNTPGLQKDSSLIDTIVVDYIKPEQLTAYEIGYKTIWGGKFFLDANFYYNVYNNFQSQVNVRNIQPAQHLGQNVGLDRSGFTTFRAYTNQAATITSWGASLGFMYKLPKGFTLGGNYSYADFSVDSTETANGFQPGFNTPNNRFNVSLEQRNELLKNFGFNISYRWQESFYWENAFGSGMVPAYGQLDAQINYTIKKWKTMIKIGATNLVGPEFVTNTGGPFVGRMAYISFTYDEFLK